eukprot:2308862-Rhodomonas_salina.1
MISPRPYVQLHPAPQRQRPRRAVSLRTCPPSAPCRAYARAAHVSEDVTCCTISRKRRPSSPEEPTMSATCPYKRG